MYRDWAVCIIIIIFSMSEKPSCTGELKGKWLSLGGDGGCRKCPCVDGVREMKKTKHFEEMCVVLVEIFVFY